MANQKNRKKFLWIILITFIIGAILGFVALFTSKSVTKESEIISRRGIHWHTLLTIKILGQYQDIPANVGLGIAENPVHTHAADGVLHMEFPGLVKKDDIEVGKFFEIWGKKFNKDCIFDKCSGSDGQLKMFVNDKENLEFESYIMRDGDKIEIIFE